jgi:hypothetical protein
MTGEFTPALSRETELGFKRSLFKTERWKAEG